MSKHVGRGLAAGSIAMIAVILTLASSGIVSAASDQSQTGQGTGGPQTFQTNLTPASNSGASGTATVTVKGNNATITIHASGLSPNLAHATHIHIGGKGACPGPEADTNKDGYISAKEAEPYIGPIKVSLTTSGDTSASSALAADRMPKADAKGSLTYSRGFTLPSGVTAASLQKGSIDIHGIASLFDDKSKYDGKKKSELDSKLPFEVTVSAACGSLTSTPAGGMETGAGSTAGIEQPGLIAAGAVGLVAAAGLGIYLHRQAINSRG